MAGIFISYRREDTSAHAGRLCDDLRDHFGRARVFMDIDTIDPGVDFGDAIQRAIGSCDVLIALIGKQWLSAADAAGQRRLDQPGDFIRREIATALERGVRVIPVLVQGASMPPASVLPEPIAGLARWNALEIADTRWRYDLDRLIHAIRRSPRRGESRPLPLYLGLGAVVLGGLALALFVVLVLSLSGGSDPPSAVATPPATVASAQAPPPTSTVAPAVAVAGAIAAPPTATAAPPPTTTAPAVANAPPPIATRPPPAPPAPPPTTTGAPANSIAAGSWTFDTRVTRNECSPQVALGAPQTFVWLFQKIARQGVYIEDFEEFAIFAQNGAYLGNATLDWPDLYVTIPPDDRRDHDHIAIEFSDPQRGTLTYTAHRFRPAGECRTIWES